MTTKSNKTKKLILIGLGTAVVGILGYFGWQYFSNRNVNLKTPESDSDNPIPLPNAKDFNNTNSKQSIRNDEFPLKKGSRGQRVKALQDALIQKYGKDILPKFGSDGDFGSEMVNALNKLSLPLSIDENTYKLITNGGDANKNNASELAKTIYKACANKNLQNALSALKLIKTTDDYSEVSTEFMKYRIGGVRKTLVNGLLDSFTDDKQKQEIRMEFLRMGLKLNGDKWSLSGFLGLTIITKKNAFVWKSPKEKIEVPANTILGTEIMKLNGFTCFENNGHKFIVNSENVKNL